MEPHQRAADATATGWELARPEDQPGEPGMSIDDFAAAPDFAISEHAAVPCPPEDAFAALRGLNLLTVRSPVVDAAMWLRGVPARMSRHAPARQRTRLTFDDLVAGGEWVRLAERPGRELVLGAAGRFWTPIVRMERLGPGEFERYDKPGRGRIAMSVSVRQYGRWGSLLSYDVRTMLDDALVKRVFRWYWRTAEAFVRLIMRATLRRAAQEATRDPEPSAGGQ